MLGRDLRHLQAVEGDGSQTAVVVVRQVVLLLLRPALSRSIHLDDQTPYVLYGCPKVVEDGDATSLPCVSSRAVDTRFLLVA